MLKNRYFLIFIIIVLNYLLIYSGSISWVFQFSINLVLTFFIYLLSKNSNLLKFIGVLPFSLLYIFLTIKDDRFDNYHIFIIAVSPLLLYVTFHLILRKSKHQLILLFSLLVFGLYGFKSIIYLDINTHDLNKRILKEYASKSIQAINFSNNIPLGKYHKDTTYILNYWASYCGVCYEKFPLLEKVSRELNAKSVKVVNIMLSENDHFKDDSLIAVEKVLSKYQIENYYLSDTSIFSPVPFTLIIKNQKTVFSGIIGYSKTELFSIYNHELFF